MNSRSGLQEGRKAAPAQSLIRKLTTDKAVKAYQEGQGKDASSAEYITNIRLSSRGIKTIESIELPSLRYCTQFSSISSLIWFRWEAYHLRVRISSCLFSVVWHDLSRQQGHCLCMHMYGVPDKTAPRSGVLVRQTDRVFYLRSCWPSLVPSGKYSWPYPMFLSVATLSSSRSTKSDECQECILQTTAARVTTCEGSFSPPLGRVGESKANTMIPCFRQAVQAVQMESCYGCSYNDCSTPSVLLWNPFLFRSSLQYKQDWKLRMMKYCYEMNITNMIDASSKDEHWWYKAIRNVTLLYSLDHVLLLLSY